LDCNKKQPFVITNVIDLYAPTSG